tara:strand:- start:16534 stop:16854 length:321 start_codon:yes stop_codon:yes gene_type:complete
MSAPDVALKDLDPKLGGFNMGHVVVKYKVTINQPEEGTPDYEQIANTISSMEEVQACEIKPLAFGMMFIEVQAVLGEGEGIVDAFENKVREDNNVGQIEALEMGRL